MNKTVIIIIRQPLEIRPPIINLIDVLISINTKIILICDKVIDSLAVKYSNRVEFVLLNLKKHNFKLLKLLDWLDFRHKTFKFMENNKELLKNGILWIGSADAALALGKKLFQHQYIFQCQELYDAFPFYQKGLKKVMQNALINVNPEDNRGAIFRSWYKLKETPITLPNKPFYHPKQRNMPIDDKNAAQIIEKIKGKKILLYQGGIVKQRDVGIIAEAIMQMQDWVLVLMGNTDTSSYLADLLKKYSRITYIPRIPAPFHLQITSWARIGLVPYSFDDLNHVFCAPNKTWEYTGFGIPLLGNNVPGIMNDIRKYGSGACCDLETCKLTEIITAIEQIDCNYDIYSKNALDFYNSIDISETIKKILESIS